MLIGRVSLQDLVWDLPAPLRSKIHCRFCKAPCHAFHKVTIARPRSYEARSVVGRLAGDYERAYYTGIIYERRAKALIRHGTPRGGARAYEWLRDAMASYEKAEELRRQGQTVVFVAIDGRAAGLMGIADPIKPFAVQAVRNLRTDGMRLVMLTGDSRATAEAVARSLGIEEFEAEVLPEKKLEVVRDLQNEGRSVAMAGDGINDAPALAQADVGIAMGTGTDVAIESGGITLVKGDLAGIARARKLSRATMRNIRQNLLFAFLYNSLGVPIAAGVLYPFFGVLLSPILAAAAMSFSSVSVIANSLRLRKLEL